MGSLANLPIGLPANVELLAYSSTGATLTYTLIGSNLPTGLVLSNSGIITGTPEYSSPSNNYFTTQTFSIIVRVTSSDGATPLDGSFSLILTNTVNSDFNWVTPAGNLGTVPNGVFYQLPLQVTNSNSAITTTFTFLSGELPPGMQVVKSGYLQGVPSLDNSITVNTSEIYKFSIRATSSAGHIRDQAFYLSVTNVYGPVIEPTSGNISTAYYLGSVFDGNYYSQQLLVTELNPNVQITWSNIGNLPRGLTLSNTGEISGYIYPLELIGNWGPAGYDSTTIVNNLYTEEQEFDYGPYDFNQLNQTLSYNFTIQAFDGANYDLQNYVLNVISRSSFTADNANITVDNSFVTINSGNVYIPVLLNGNVTTLPEGRSGAYYSYKFDGYDFQGETVIYSLSNDVGRFDSYVLGIDAGFDYGSSNPEGPNYSGGGVGFDSFVAGLANTNNLPGLELDQATGWLYGKITPQSSALTNYKFGLQVSKVLNGITYSNITQYFILPVLGDINNVIEWVSPSDLGTILNGSISELVISANSIENKTLSYFIVDQADLPARLPQGLKLLPSGEISGRVTFESFSIDGYDTVPTTFDGSSMTFDRTYTFTVQAVTNDFVFNPDGTFLVSPSASAQQKFTIILEVDDIIPYDNLYLRAMPNANQRQIFNNIINNTEIFNPDLIYRHDDPWFGIATDMTMLFLAGLNPKDISIYAAAIMYNHYNKKYQFGDIKTAVVLDDVYNVKYEVVYVEVIDPEIFNTNGIENGPSLSIALTGNPYIDSQGNSFNIMYPNTSENMMKRITSAIGYYDQSSLPRWMTSNQLGTTAGTFNTPLGFTMAVVLAYTQPGASNLIAFRLHNAGLNFSQIDFTVDRYLLDNYYNLNNDTDTGSYYVGRETTFDVNPNLNVGVIVATIDYAVTIPFSQINGRSVDYINANGGIDGITSFQDGDTLVFAKQQGFLNSSSYDGWVDYVDGFIGNNLITTVAGYDKDPYDDYTLIPGYLEQAIGTSTVNQQGGIWKINLADGYVTLSFVQEISISERVRVSFGETYGGSIIYYSRELTPGLTVPAYEVFNYQASSVIQTPTTFNAGTTRFFSYRDQYYTPNSQDKYIKFPQFGVFN